MTFEERMAELGVDLSDIPAQHSMAILLDKRGRHIMTTGRTLELLEELARADDIIDRMETRLDNVTQERDWLVDLMKMRCGCDACEFRDTDGPECDACDPIDDPGFVYGGVPEEDRL